MRQFLLVALCVFGFAVVAPAQISPNDPSADQVLAADLAKAYADYQTDATKANDALDATLAEIEQAYLAEQRRALAARDRRALITVYVKKLAAADNARLDWRDTMDQLNTRLAKQRAEAYRNYLRNS